VAFEDMTEHAPIQWLWEFEPNTVQFIEGTDETSQNPIVIFTEAATYDVKLTATNLNGSSETIKEDYVIAGGFEPYYKETFEGGNFKDAHWTVENPANSFTWGLRETGGTQPGNLSAGIIFKEEQVIGQKDRLISPQLNLTGMSSAVLEFQHAYAQFTDGFSDSLVVYVSFDCSENWERVATYGEDGSGSFATHEMTDDFWPEVESDWCMSGWGSGCNVIDLTPWTGKSGVRIAFETYSYFGNPMFIDNVIISQFVGQDEIGTESSDITVFPNPASGTFKVELPAGHQYDELHLVNYLGQTVYSAKISSDSKSLNITPAAGQSPGIYFLKLSGNGETTSKKVILN
jgi:PKD repeat protein